MQPARAVLYAPCPTTKLRRAPQSAVAEGALTVPAIETTAATPRYAYVPRTGWPAWAVLPATFAIFLGASAIGFCVSYAIVAWAPAGAESDVVPMHMLLAGLAGVQVGIIALTILFAGFFSSDRAETLALRPPVGGWGVLPLSLIPLFALTGIWTVALLLWRPDIVVADLRPFQEMMKAGVLPVLILIAVGAPLSEELLFRGFLFSGLAKSRLGLIGTSILTSIGWTALHAGYSVFGLLEVLVIGLYFSWLLVRTGSLWVTIFAHAVYNLVVGLVLVFVTLPAT